VQSDSIIFTIFLIFTGAAVFATIALYARQSLLVVYIVLGILMGPSGFHLITDGETIKEIAHVGIMFLLFLLGLNLPPVKLLQLIKETLWVAGLTVLLFALFGFGIAWIFRYSVADSLIIAVAMMFSSTIIGLKLLPTTVLHHRRTGDIIISILLLQDIVAILVLLLLQASANDQSLIQGAVKLGFSLISLSGLVYVFTRYVLIPVMTRFDKIREYLFLTAVGWCLGIAVTARVLGLSYEIGAFIAGVALATSPIAMYLADELKPLRDFFLIMFFFTVGAAFDLNMAEEVLIPALVLAILILSVKPLVFSFLLRKNHEEPGLATEIGFRLGQSSEFSLLIAVLALELGVVSNNAAYLIQVSTIITFVVSSYLVVLKYPTPMAVSDKLRRD